jgi:hypothetical protein
MIYLKNYESYEFDDDFTGKDGMERWHLHRQRMKDDLDYRSEYRKWQDIKLREEWMELNPFVKSTDVPFLPKPLDDFYINRLIELGAIPKSELIDGQWYYGDFRNSEFGKWNALKNEFYYIRYKFGNRWDTCNHFEDDNGSALFTPIRKVTEEEMKEIKELENEVSI